MNDRTPISEGGYYAHRNCGTGDRIRATDADGNLETEPTTIESIVIQQARTRTETD